MSQCQAKLGNIPLGLLEGWINGREALAGCAVAGGRRAAPLWASKSEPGCSSSLAQSGQRKGKAARRFLPEAFFTQLQARDQTEMLLHCCNQTLGVLGAPGRGERLLLPPLLLVLPENLTLVLGQASRETEGPSGGAETLVGATGRRFIPEPCSAHCCRPLHSAGLGRGSPRAILRRLHLSVKEFSTARASSLSRSTMCSSQAINSRSIPASAGCPCFVGAVRGTQ